jgi:hypothetical protein
VREPFHKKTMEQRALKESYAWEAARRANMSGEEIMGLLQGFITREKEPALVVYNTLSQPRSGMVVLYIDHQTIPRYASFEIVDAMGTRMATQPVESHSDGTYRAIQVDKIPAFGFKKFFIRLLPDPPFAPVPHEPFSRQTYTNAYYRITIDTVKGLIRQITDIETGLKLIDTTANYGFGEFIYELPSNREQMESFHLTHFTRETPTDIHFESYEEGAIWNTFRFRSNTRASATEGGLLTEIRVFNATKRIDLVYSLDKKLVTDPEGIYIAFPFFSENGEAAFDVPGGEVRPGIDQIPGSSNDWNTVQTYARIYNSGSQILLMSSEIPMMQFGGINTGRFQADAKPASYHIYGWPMNNYWTTNFNADQHGGHTWTYTLTSMAVNSASRAAEEGLSYHTPFPARVLPGGGTGTGSKEGSFITGWPENLLLISAIPDQTGKSIVLHLRNTGKTAITPVLKNGLTGKELKLIPADVTGRILQNTSASMKALESRFFLINL